MRNYHAVAFILAFVFFIVATFETKSGVQWQWLACACVVAAVAL